MRFGRFDVATFFSFFAYASGTVVLPVALVTLADDLGFPLAAGGMTAGGALHLGRTGAVVASMLLCGFAAGRWGKRRTLGVSVVLLSSGLLLCCLAPSYGILFTALLVAGLGEGTVEGLATPFVQELHPTESGRYINFTHAFWSVGVLVTVLVSGGLLALGISWRLVIAGVAVTGLIPAVLLLSPPRSGRDGSAHPEPLRWSTVAGHASEILRHPRFWLFFAAMFVAGGGEFGLTYWAASYIQLNINSSAFAGGAGVACFAGGMILGRISWGYLIRQHRLRALIAYSSLGGTAVTLMLPAVQNLHLFLALLVVAGFATAPLWPSVQSYCADRMPAVDTTMLFILLSCAGIPGAGGLTWLMGAIGNRGDGLRPALYLVPICFLVLAVLISVDGLQARRAPRYTARR